MRISLGGCLLTAVALACGAPTTVRAQALNATTVEQTRTSAALRPPFVVTPVEVDEQQPVPVQPTPR